MKNRNQFYNQINIKKFNIFLIVFIVLFAFSIYHSTGLTIGTIQETVTEKIYSNVDITENFDDASVIVVVNNNAKNHITSLLNNIQYETIENLTCTDEHQSEDLDNQEQILKINLSENTKENVIEVIKQLEIVDGIKYAGPNRIFELDTIPNDPFYSNSINSLLGQWGLQKIESNLAWDFTTGTESVRIGIIDTGIADHPDLNANVVGGGDFVTMKNGTTPGILRDDPQGHGTHVAGIAGAVGNQTIPTGVTGVNWNVTLVPMQVASDDGGIHVDAIVRAINYATNLWNTVNRISILSMSIGGSSEMTAIETAIRAYPGLFVCSSGNSGGNNDEIRYYPSFYASSLHSNPLTNMIVVGRSDINDSRPSTSNWGSKTITLYAPGEHILSTYPEEFCAAHSGVIRSTRWGDYLDCECTWGNYYGIWEWIPNNTRHLANGYHFISGSSMATPHVSGVAALLLSINPNLTTAQLKEAIINSVDIPNVDGVNPLEGLCVTNGRLNAYNAVRYILETYALDSYSLGYNTVIDIDKTIDANGSYFVEKNAMIQLSKQNYAYGFAINSNFPINVVVYDQNFNEITIAKTTLDSGCKVCFQPSLTSGTYYLKVNYTDLNKSGTINISIHCHSYEDHYCTMCNQYTETHDYHDPYTWVNFSKHDATCGCGATTQQGHAVSSSGGSLLGSGTRYKTCLLCGGSAEIGFVQLNATSTEIEYVTEKGSYILPNGVIVLVDEDIEAYMNHTILFQKKNNSLTTE